MIYEHINCFTEFDPSISFPFKNWPEANKPYGGLWGSKVDSTKGWRYYLNEIEKMPDLIDNSSSFRFKLKPWANVKVIRSYSDYLDLPKSIDLEGNEYVDYIQCLNDGIDAVELQSLGDEYEKYYDEETIDLFDEAFCSHWQCDSIVVLNRDAYEIIE